MKKAILVLALVLVAGCSSPPADTPEALVVADTERVATQGTEITPASGEFGFEGYGPGKSHSGTFERWRALVGKSGDNIDSVLLTADASSVKTGISALDKDLASDNFFYSEKYPEITFTSDSVGTTVTGELTLRGVTKTISFPAERTQDRISADFLIDSSLFGISHPAVHKDIRIFFDLNI